MKTTVVVPWHNSGQLEAFVQAWGISRTDQRVLFQQDERRHGCAATKNAGIRQAISEGADVIIILDDDCYPHDGQDLGNFIEGHIAALEPQSVTMFDCVTDPPSRGTPYFSRTIEMPVAASMGFWTHVGDYDAPGQLVYGATRPMQFRTEPRFGRYFPLCGMNLAFRASEWPWCQFVDVARFDDIWQGFLWQKKAYADRKCFNLNGPIVRHSRQSNVWANLRDESASMERNELIWQEIDRMPLLPHGEMIERLGLHVGPKP